MTTTPIATNYPTREAWLNAFVTFARPHFERVGAPLPERVRVSVGFTSQGARSNRIGECWNDTASADSYFEIFLKPSIENDARIADTLTHELVHAAVGLAAGHGKRFAAVATALGLTGRMTSTTAGTDWYLWALPILAELGAMPYGVLTGGQSSAKPKQKTYLLKVECPSCGWLARVSNKHMDHATLHCPLPDCDGELQTVD
jgi:hypothetical protein